MECIELWHAEHVELPVRSGTYADLRRSGSVVDIDKLTRRNGGHVDETRIRDWIEGYDLIQCRSIWVPRECVVVSGVEPPSDGFSQTTNGLAAGNTKAEATVHALCELIERDAFALWQADSSDPDGSASHLNLDTVADPGCRRLIARYQEARVLVAVHDMTSDVGIASYTCLLSDRPGNFRSLGYEYGSGTHLSPAVAVSRALTEAAQSRLTTIAGSRDDIGPATYLARDEEDLREVEALITGARPRVRFDRPDLAAETMGADIATLVERLRSVGVSSLVVVDLTRRALGVPVVKVVATELEGPTGVEPNVRVRSSWAGT